MRLGEDRRGWRRLGYFGGGWDTLEEVGILWVRLVKAVKHLLV